MGTSFAIPPVQSSYSLHHRLFPRFSPPGNHTIKEDLEDGNTTQPEVSSRFIRTRESPQSSTYQSHIDAAMTTDQRRNSFMSASIPRSYSDAETPNVGALTAERESMRTPRPLTSESPKTNRLALLPDSAFANRRKEASDATIEAKYASHHLEGASRNESPTNMNSEMGPMNTPEYSTNSLGKASLASSAYTGRQSGSEYGDRSAFSTSSAARKAKKKAVAPPEVLVIVRPPPSKQVNPLNLQIQLVIPQSQTNAATSRSSLDSSRDDTSVISASLSTGSNGIAPSISSNLTALTPTKPSLLRRSSSTHSARSSRSEASSGGMSCSSSTTGASRRVTPLYNLNFHSITATTVTDAGTDDKVAKFGKRGVEIDGFGQLEPHELIRGINDLVSLQERRRSSLKDSLALHAQSQKSGSNLNLTDAMSEVSRTRSRQNGSPLLPPPRASIDLGAPVQLRPNEEPPTSFDAMSPEAKNPTEGGLLGGKFLSKFKRFSINPASSTTNTSVRNSTFGSPSRTATAASESSNVASVFSKVTSAAVSKIRESGGGTNPMAGLSDEQSEIKSAKESMVSMGAQPNGINIDTPQLIVGGGLRGDYRRTEGYYWTVRKWNRRNAQEDVEEGEAQSWHKEAGNNPILNSVWKRFNIVNRMGGQEMHPPCRDVPVRFEWTRSTDHRKSSAVSSGHGKASTDGNGVKSRLGNMPRSSFSRPSTDVKNGDALKPPKSTSRPSSVYSNMSASRRSVDAGSQAGSHIGSVEDGEMSDPEDSETVWACHLVLGPTTRIPIGSLTPTPHHPKLVGQLTIPFPLPDLSQSGLGTDGAGLTREELKDIISVTCLFVVIREGFGGLVKKKR